MNTATFTGKTFSLKQALRSPVNMVSAVIILAGVAIMLARLAGGIGAVTALDNRTPWGLWISFDLLCGIALAAGGYTTSCAVLLLGRKAYRAALAPAVATAFLGYMFEVIALIADVGQPWRLHYPMLWSPGPQSILFVVGLCVACYLTLSAAQLGAFLSLPDCALLQKAQRLCKRFLIPLTILGASIAIIHQASLGGLYLIAPGKLHPLWYSNFLPLFFLVSSLYAGLSMVMAEGSLAGHADKSLMLGFGKAAGYITAGYFLIRVFDFGLKGNWIWLNGTYGALWLTELFALTLLPCLLFLFGSKVKNISIIRLAAGLAVAGIMLNRFCVGLVAFNWQLPASERYFPSLLEICFSISMVVMLISIYRFLHAYMMKPQH